jgi:predicted nucleotidyltransferase
MKMNYLDISGRIEPSLIEIVETVTQVAEPLSVSFFLIGATVRDLILTTVYGINTIRATADIDFAICISDWDQFYKLKDGLLSSTKFNPTKLVHRLDFKSEVLVDLVPFGPIAGRYKQYSWPSESGIIMNTIGFEEAFEHSIRIKLRSEPRLEIKIASLAALVITKIISWKDKYPDRARDAQDILLILKNYTDAGNQERMFDEALDLVEKEDFDYEYAGARLLGRDIAAFISGETKKVVLDILEDETEDQSQYQFIEQMRSGDSFEYSLKLLEELKAGITDPI